MSIISKKTVSAIGVSLAVGGAVLFSTTDAGKSLFGDSSPVRYNSAILISSGGIMWDSEYRSFLTNVLDSTDFKLWMSNNNVIGVTHDIPDPDTGACIYSYKVSKLGCSGAGWLSRKGITNTEEVAQIQRNIGSTYRRTGTGNSPELILVSMDDDAESGTVIGRLEPYLKNGTYPVSEHISRLDEFMVKSDQPYEDPTNPVARAGIRFLRSYIEIPENKGFVEIPMISEMDTSTQVVISVSVAQWKPSNIGSTTYENATEGTDFTILSHEIPFHNVATNSIKMRVARGTKDKRNPNKAFRIATNNNQSIDVVIKDVD